MACAAFSPADLLSGNYFLLYFEMASWRERYIYIYNHLPRKSDIPFTEGGDKSESCPVFGVFLNVLTEA